MAGRTPWFTLAALLLGYFFLYGPIVSIIIYSFNESRLVTVWAGFSTKWYGELFRDDDMLGAAWLSLQIAVISATIATSLGTIAGFVMARFGRFSGRTLFSIMLAAPLVMPEVITGISMLLLFVGMQDAFGWPAGRGMVTLIIAHTTFTLAFVAVIVQSRLTDMDPSIEEAALDLGARPFKVFFVVTLPIISPALLSGWLLAFSLSLDDVVTSQFVSGPGSTTLPLVVFSSVKLGVSPEINALGSIIVLIVSLGTIATGITIARRERARLRFSKETKDEELKIVAPARERPMPARTTSPA